MAEIRLHVDEAALCVKGAQLILHGVRRDRAGQTVDHVDVVLPWAFRAQLARTTNFDGIDYRSLDGDAQH